MSAPADLQPTLTVSRLARAFRVSERQIYLARRLLRLRPDLAVAVESGAMSLNKAVKIAEAKPEATRWDRLVRAWNAASDEERARLLKEATEGDHDADGL